MKIGSKETEHRPNMKDVDLGEPTSSFDHVYLGCTQRECVGDEARNWL